MIFTITIKLEEILADKTHHCWISQSIPIIADDLKEAGKLHNEVSGVVLQHLREWGHRGERQWNTKL